MADRTLTETSDIDIDESVAGQTLLTLKPRAFASLTDGATITWATDGKQLVNAKVTLGGNRTLAITGAVDGQTGTLIVTQDGTGSRTLTLPAGSKVEGGSLALSTAASAVDVLAYVYDGTSYYWTIGKAFA